MNDRVLFGDLSPYPHARLSYDGVLRSSNGAWARYFGGGVDAFVGEPLYRLVEPADRTDFLALWESLDRTDDTRHRLLRAGRGSHTGPAQWLFRTRADDDFIVVTVVATDLPLGPDVAPGFHQGIVGALEQVGVGLAVLEEGSIVWANAFFATIVGLEPALLVGRLVENVVADEDRPRLRQSFASDMGPVVVQLRGTDSVAPCCVTGIPGDPLDRQLLATFGQFSGRDVLS